MMQRAFFIIECGIARSALCVYSKFGHHPHPIGYLYVKNFISFGTFIAKLAHG